MAPKRSPSGKRKANTGPADTRKKPREAAQVSDTPDETDTPTADSEGEQEIVFTATSSNPQTDLCQVRRVEAELKLSACQSDFRAIMSDIEAAFHGYDEVNDNERACKAGVLQDLLRELEEAYTFIKDSYREMLHCFVASVTHPEDPLIDAISLQRCTVANLRQRIRIAVKGIQELDGPPAAPSVCGSSAGSPQFDPIFLTSYDPVKEGISFSGDSASDFARFEVQWRTADDELVKRKKSEIDIFRQLKRCLRGKAKEHVINIVELEGCYALAWKLLRKLYDKPLNNAVNIITSILKSPLVQDSHEDYSSFLAVWTSAKQALKSFQFTPEEHVELIYIAMANSRLSSEARDEWNKFLKAKCLDPNSKTGFHLDEETMENFLLHRVDTTTGKEKEKYVPSKNGKNGFEKTSGIRSSTPSTFVSVDKGRFCQFCSRQGHTEETCRTLSTFPPQHILQVCRRKKLCFGCYRLLSGQHLCTVVCPRRDCNHHHSGLLHDLLRETLRPGDRGEHKASFGPSWSGAQRNGGPGGYTRYPGAYLHRQENKEKSSGPRPEDNSKPSPGKT